MHFKQFCNNMPKGLAFIQIINDEHKYVYASFGYLEIKISRNYGCSFKVKQHMQVHGLLDHFR